MAASLLTTPMQALAHPQSHTERTEGITWLVDIQTSVEPRFYFVFNSEPHLSHAFTAFTEEVRLVLGLPKLGERR